MLFYKHFISSSSPHTDAEVPPSLSIWYAHDFLWCFSLNKIWSKHCVLPVSLLTVILKCCCIVNARRQHQQYSTRGSHNVMAGGDSRRWVRPQQGCGHAPRGLFSGICLSKTSSTHLGAGPRTQSSVRKETK